MQSSNPANSAQDFSSDDFSSDGWEEETWEEYVSLPKGYVLEDDVPREPEVYLKQHFLSQKYKNGVCKFALRYERVCVVTRLCPCGTPECKTHENGSDKMRPFRRWNSICEFPTGHSLRGDVRVGEEMHCLEERFKENYKIIQFGDTFQVKQVCPCNKTECKKHIFPSKVRLESTFKLAVYTIPTVNVPQQTTLLEPLFRQQHPMTPDQVKQFFDKFELNWEISVSCDKISFMMLCKCNQAFAYTPCETCQDKNWSKCSLCSDTRHKRMLKKQHPSKKSDQRICSDCKVSEMTFCAFCKKNQRLDHTCVALDQQHVSFRKNTVHKPLAHKVGSNVGICPYCKQTCARRAYPRHFKRCHADLKPSGMYSHDVKKHHCQYCDYYHSDSTNVKEHSKFHSLRRNHPCKLGCGKSFRHHPEEISHRRKMHGIKAPQPKRKHRRVGNVMQLTKKKKGLAL